MVLQFDRARARAPVCTLLLASGKDLPPTRYCLTQAGTSGGNTFPQARGEGALAFDMKVFIQEGCMMNMDRMDKKGRWDAQRAANRHIQRPQSQNQMKAGLSEALLQSLR